MKSKRDGETSVRLPPEAGKFFRTMVLMGGSIALACSGRTIEAADEGDGSGGESGSSGGAAAGGVIHLPQGTGGSMLGVGGQRGVEPGPFECPPQQWDCSELRPECAYDPSIDDGYQPVLPSTCTCDSSRPLHKSECPEGEVFTCAQAAYDQEGELMTELVKFACECVAPQDFKHCGKYCSALDVKLGQPVYCSPEEASAESEEWDEVLCGCEIPILR